jgi:ankyrin repeat protein
VEAQETEETEDGGGGVTVEAEDGGGGGGSGQGLSEVISHFDSLPQSLKDRINAFIHGRLSPQTNNRPAPQFTCYGAEDCAGKSNGIKSRIRKCCEAGKSYSYSLNINYIDGTSDAESICKNCPSKKYIKKHFNTEHGADAETRKQLVEYCMEKFRQSTKMDEFLEYLDKQGDKEKQILSSAIRSILAPSSKITVNLREFKKELKELKKQAELASLKSAELEEQMNQDIRTPVEKAEAQQNLDATNKVRREKTKAYQEKIEKRLQQQQEAEKLAEEKLAKDIAENKLKMKMVKKAPRPKRTKQKSIPKEYVKTDFFIRHLINKQTNNQKLKDELEKWSRSDYGEVANNFPYDLLITAIQKGNIEIIKELFKINCVYIDDEIDNLGRTALLTAAKYGKMVLVKYFIEKGADINEEDKAGFTPLFMAAMDGHIEVVKMLVEKGATIDALTNTGFTPITVAADRGRLPVVEYLLEHGANINMKTIEGETTLFRAAIGNQPKVFEYLLEHGADINTMDTKNHTPLHIAAKNGNMDLVAMIIESNPAFDINSEANGLLTPLCLAALKGNVEVVKYLIGKGANLNAEDIHGMSPLHWAALYGHAEVVNVLLDSNSLIDGLTKNMETPIFLAALSGNAEVVKILIGKGVDFNMANNEGMSPLHAAVKEGKIDVVEILINAGININAVDNTGDNALLIAIRNGHNKLIHLLIEKGIDITLENHDGFTPLILAVWKNNFVAVVMLLKKGSDVLTKRTKKQFTPLQVANNSKSQFDLKLKNIDRELENIDRKIREAADTKSVHSRQKAKELLTKKKELGNMKQAKELLTKRQHWEKNHLMTEMKELTTQADANNRICLLIEEEEKKQLQDMLTAEADVEPLVVVETLVADSVGQTDLDAIRSAASSADK